MHIRLLNIIRYKTGEGDMIEPDNYTDICKMMLESILPVLDLEKYIPVMAPQELHDFDQVIQGRRKPDFSPELLEKWQILLRLREDEISAKIQSAMLKSETVCKQKKANK